MQIAGSKCGICRDRIVFWDEGAFCERCGKVVHRKCARELGCDMCGQPYEYQVPPAANPSAEAVLPRALRPASSAAPMGVAMILGFSALLLVSLVLYLMTLK